MTHQAYSRNTLTRKYKSELVQICVERGIDRTGLKVDLINRIIEAQPQKAAKPVPQTLVMGNGVEIIDHAQYRQTQLPDGVVRYEVSQHGEYVGGVWIIGDRYYCKLSSNDGEATLEEAVALLCLDESNYTDCGEDVIDDETAIHELAVSAFEDLADRILAARDRIDQMRSHLDGWGDCCDEDDIVTDEEDIALVVDNYHERVCAELQLEMLVDDAGDIIVFQRRECLGILRLKLRGYYTTLNNRYDSQFTAALSLCSSGEVLAGMQAVENLPVVYIPEYY